MRFFWVIHSILCSSGLTKNRSMLITAHMIKHIVLLKFKEDVSETRIDSCFASLRALQNDIPEILSFSHGRYQSPEGLNQGFGHGFEMEFHDEQCRDIYLDHPTHKAVATDIVVPLLEDGLNSVIAFDYVK